MLDLENIGSPKEFWDYFKEICKIPRCSGREEGIRSHIEQIAINFGYDTKIDTVGNLIVKISSKDKDIDCLGIIFQCHMDMVCEKNNDVSHNFEIDPINLKIFKDKEEYWLTAKGTTLGADNGVGIAYCLALMNRIYNHKININNLSIEFLFTVQEESGLTGVFNIQKGFLDGNYLINLDSEEDDRFIIGCAGGINTEGKLNIDFKNINEINKKITPIQLSVTGLIGGHSGVDINKGRANAIKIISKILWKINNRFGIYLNSISGGKLSNAIPRETESIFYVEETKISEIFSLVDQIKLEIEMEIKSNEKNLKIKYKKLETIERERIFPKPISDKLLHILYVIPNGPISIHSKNQDLVYTSTNLASIKMEGELLTIITSQRSLHKTSKQIISERIEALFKLADLDINIRHSGDYPEWDPNFKSTLLKIVKNSYKELYNKEAIISTIHAGLETSILKQNFPDIEMISIGPLIEGTHSPDEKLNIKSVEKIWKLIELLIKKFH